MCLCIFQAFYQRYQGTATNAVSWTSYEWNTENVVNTTITVQEFQRERNTNAVVNTTREGTRIPVQPENYAVAQ